MERAWGIDVSHYHRVLDWDGLARGGCAFFGAKATNGRARDVAIAGHRDVARLHPFDLVVYYHFPTPGSPAVLQAQNLVATIGDLMPNERLALDVEEDPGTDWCPGVPFIAAFFAEIDRLTGDRRFLVYTSARVWRELMGSPSWAGAITTDCWLAHYGQDEPKLPEDSAGYPIWPKWTIWQDSEDFACPFVDGGVADHDVFAGDRAALQAYVRDSGPRP